MVCSRIRRIVAQREVHPESAPATASHRREPGPPGPARREIVCGRADRRACRHNALPPPGGGPPRPPDICARPDPLPRRSPPRLPIQACWTARAQGSHDEPTNVAIDSPTAAAACQPHRRHPGRRRPGRDPRDHALLRALGRPADPAGAVRGPDAGPTTNTWKTPAAHRTRERQGRRNGRCSSSGRRVHCALVRSPPSGARRGPRQWADAVRTRVRRPSSTATATSDRAPSTRSR